MPFVLPMLSTPGRVPVPPARPRPPDARLRTGLWTRVRTGPHRCPQAVHGRRRVVPGSAPGRGRRSASLQVGARVRAGERAVRRSADRRGRPARRDPDVRRGATATLTAPSTARQRSVGPPPGASPRRAVAASPRPSGWTMGGRDVPGRRPPRSSVMLAGVCAAVRRRRVWLQVTSFRGHRGRRHRRPPAAPRASAHRRVRTADVV